MFQKKQKDKTPEEELSELEISNLCDHGQEIEVIIIKILKEPEKVGWTELEVKNFKKELENMKKNQTGRIQ